ncbi:MAG: hypothetical protein JW862_03615 [Anaerolineales bacterium]|nr:hypothetical protein [Anaerolineales bacterium]
MNFKEVLGLLFLIFSGLVVYGPYFVLRQRTRLVGRLFVEFYPQLSWLEWAHPLATFTWILLLFLGGSRVLNSSAWLARLSMENFFYLAGAGLAGFSIITGVLVLVSGVCPLPLRTASEYVVEEGVQKSGWLFLALGLVVMLGGGLIFYLTIPV